MKSGVKTDLAQGAAKGKSFGGTGRPFERGAATAFRLS
jgi:hypothetical protein